MAKYRKKPVVVQAEMYRAGIEDGWECEDQIPSLTDGMFAVSRVEGVRLYPYIATLEGRYFITEGDWVITGQANERWPVSDEKFRAIYDRRDDGQIVSKPSVRDAMRMPNDFAIFCSGGTLSGKAGDYLVLATPDDAYPIAADIFAMSYEQVQEG